MNATAMTAHIEHVVRLGIHPATALVELAAGIPQEQAFDFWWTITGIGVDAARPTLTPPPAGEPWTPCWRHAGCGHVLDPDDVPPAYRVHGRWLAARLNDDTDTGHALWESITSRQVGDWFVWQLWTDTLRWVAERLHRQAHQQ